MQKRSEKSFQAKPPLSSNKLINSITDLMLDKFVICLCEKDLSPLIIEGNPSKKQLQDAWQKVYDEYCDALKTKQQKGMKNLVTEVTILQQRVFAIHACVFRLSIQHSDEIVLELKKWINVREKLKPDNKEQYEKDLQSILTRCQSKYEIELKQRAKELEESVPKENQKVDKWYFEKMIVQLQKHMGISINKFKTTVASFVFMMADLLAKGEELDRQLRKA